MNRTDPLMVQRLWRGRLSTKVYDLVGILRLTPFDESTAEGRSKERYRRVALTSIAMAGAQGLSILAELITVPLVLGYLGAERYGLWITISSLVTVLGFADFGLGYGLLNAVSEAHGRNDRREAVAYISSATAMLTAIAALFALCFALAYPFIPWQGLFNVSSSQAVIEAGPVVAIFAGSFSLNLLLGIVQRVQMGYQRGFITSIWSGVGSLFGLCGVLFAIRLQAGLPGLAIALFGGPIVATAMNGIIFFGFRFPWLRPNPSSVELRSVQKIMRVGFFFFLLQLSGAFAYQSDSLIVARILGAEQVTHYAVPMRMFLFVPVVLGFVLMPLWPAYTESIARGDVLWIRQTLLRSLGIAFLGSLVLSTLLVIFGGSIVQRWVGGEVVPSALLLFALGIWAVLSCVGGATAMLLNGVGALKFQVVCAVFMVLGNIALSVFLTKRIGVSGVVWGSIIAQLIFVTIPTAFFIPRLLRTMSDAPAAA